jgi:hypothetical protein
VSVVYGSLTTAIIVLLSLEVAATLLLLGAQVIAEYERIEIGGPRRSRCRCTPKPPESAALRPPVVLVLDDVDHGNHWGVSNNISSSPVALLSLPARPAGHPYTTGRLIKYCIFPAVRHVGSTIR